MTAEYGPDVVGAAEGVPVALHDQERDRDGGQLGGSAALGAPRGMQREPLWQYAVGTLLGRRAARDPGAGAAPAQHERAGEPAGVPQVSEDGAPGDVEAGGRGRDPLAGDPPRLLHPQHRPARTGHRLGHGGEIGGVDAATRSGTQDEGSGGPR